MSALEDGRSPCGVGLLPEVKPVPVSPADAAAIPNAGFHPSEFIADELEARGWSRSDMARRMGGDDAVTNLFALDMYCEIGPKNPGLRLDEFTAKQFARAFGTSAKYWLNLQTAWLAAQRIEAGTVETAGLDPKDESPVPKACAQSEAP